jgi:hypothetical protein
VCGLPATSLLYVLPAFVLGWRTGRTCARESASASQPKPIT